MNATRSAPLVLSALAAGSRDRQLALGVALASTVLFLALAPFAKRPLGELAAFIPTAQTALIINDIVTATLLLGQLRVIRAPALLVLACGYVFTALMALAHMLSFPGAFAASGLLGAREQTTAYLFIFWHAGFPLFVIAYAILRPRPAQASWSPPVVPAILGVLALSVALVLAATAGHDFLPRVLRGHQYAGAFDPVRLATWALPALALAVLWRRRPHSVLDLWVMATLAAWWFEIALVGIFNSGRYDVGFYAGRLYGLAASSFVLIVLLTEQGKVYASLVKANASAAAEASLRQDRDVLSLAMRGGRMGVWTRDLASDTVWWSRELEEIFGLPPGDYPKGREAFYEYVHPGDRAALRHAADEAMASGGEYAVELRFRHASGEWRWLDLRGHAVRSADGRPVTVSGVGIDITARKRAEQAAEESEARFRTMVDAMPQLAWMARPDGWIYWYNQRWYAYTGTTPEQMAGWGWQSVHDPQTLPSVVERWRRSIATGEPFEMVFPLRGADGAFRPFLTRVSPLKDADGRVLHWFGTNTDITAQRDAEEALRLADRRKDEFLATLAHELRNPLAPIRSAVEILGRVGPLPETVEWARSILDRQARHLTRLVDDLLEVSRITQGKVQLRRERLALARPLEDAIEAVRPALEAAGHQLSVSLPREPLEVEGDATRLTQIFLNLLNNAVKFTPRGGRILLGAERRDGEALVRVADTGIGIPAEHLPKLFEMFSQVSPALERTEGGLGIGLALVRGLVALHGGSIEARSAGVGKGAEFTVRLPLAAAPAGEAKATAAAGEEAGFVRKRVLVVDDNRDAATTLRRLLEMAGHEVREAHDGVEGVHAAANFRPHVVLLDIGMPRMNGYEAAREIRSRMDRGVRIIALTGWGQEADKQRAAEAGFDLHLTKPVDPATLEAVLNR